MTAPTAAELLDLAERCEKATGPDRELDVTIALAQPDRFFNAGPQYDGAPDSIGTIDPSDGSQSIPGNAHDMLVPRYTSSLDAAMTLVPEGCHWSLRKTPLNNYLASVFVIAPNGSDRPYVPDTFEQVQAATAANALAAAALRAHAAMIGGEG